ncbi:unnamed protein product [Dracunculus medinensis]|uniref:tRNA modification GTPase MnmE n=1 Tax=Dracunculus medinensis TaxID=318479 RepID=A0A0N4UF73_DRAME|nr:unnamed protein product [Dracunculus medinensis]
MFEIGYVIRVAYRRCTIFALSSGSLPSAIAIVRTSGDKSYFCMQQLTRKKILVPRELFYSKLFTKNGELIDQAMNVFLPDTAEFFVHGSRPVVDSLCDALNEFDGVRPAKAGEFTKRAFFNSKLSFSQVQSLSFLLNAETQRQRKLAVKERALGTVVEPIRAKLIATRSSLEAAIDFADDVGMDRFKLIKNVESIINDLKSMKLQSERGSLIINGIRVVLIGRTNTGKSSLINRIAHRDVAIVSEVEGTTRDALEARVEMSSIPVIFTDTAGIRNSRDFIETEGVLRAFARVKEADIVLLVIDASTCTDIVDEVRKLMQECSVKRESHVIVVCNKADLITDKFKQFLPWKIVYTSCIIPNGWQTLIYMTGFKIVEIGDMAIVAEILRKASDYIGEITGAIVNEDILEKLFSSFCIGK